MYSRLDSNYYQNESRSARQPFQILSANPCSEQTQQQQQSLQLRQPQSNIVPCFVINSICLKEAEEQQEIVSSITTKSNKYQKSGMSPRPAFTQPIASYPNASQPSSVASSIEDFSLQMASKDHSSSNERNQLINVLLKSSDTTGDAELRSTRKEFESTKIQTEFIRAGSHESKPSARPLFPSAITTTQTPRRSCVERIEVNSKRDVGGRGTSSLNRLKTLIKQVNQELDSNPTSLLTNRIVVLNTTTPAKPLQLKHEQYQPIRTSNRIECPNYSEQKQMGEIAVENGVKTGMMMHNNSNQINISDNEHYGTSFSRVTSVPFFGNARTHNSNERYDGNQNQQRINVIPISHHAPNFSTQPESSFLSKQLVQIQESLQFQPKIQPELHSIPRTPRQLMSSNMKRQLQQQSNAIQITPFECRMSDRLRDVLILNNENKLDCMKKSCSDQYNQFDFDEKKSNQGLCEQYSLTDSTDACIRESEEIIYRQQMQLDDACMQLRRMLAKSAMKTKQEEGFDANKRQGARNEILKDEGSPHSRVQGVSFGRGLVSQQDMKQDSASSASYIHAAAVKESSELGIISDEELINIQCYTQSTDDVANMSDDIFLSIRDI